MHNSQLIQRYIYWLVFGILMFVLALAGAFTGELRGRFGEVAYRAKDPKRVWWSIAFYCLAGIGFIVEFLYKVHAFSNW
jgi:hypothetical protein